MTGRITNENDSFKDEMFAVWVNAKLTELRDAGLILSWQQYPEGTWFEMPDPDPNPAELEATRDKLSPVAWEMYERIREQQAFRRQRGDPPPHGPQSPQ